MLIPVILSGGAGTRLWPVSRKAHPKPFMQLADGQSLAAHTLQRALAVADANEVLTVTARDYYFYTRDIYQQVRDRNSSGDRSDCRFILEPSARNTAPAIAMAALSIAARHGADACMLVMPADHLVRKPDSFVAAVSRATALAADGHLVTFGIQPTHAETGYGYIRLGTALAGDAQAVAAHAVAQFVEKPDLATATDYLQQGCYRWNAGIFCFRCDSYLQALQAHQPVLYAGVQALWESLSAAQTMPLELPAAAYAALPSISIDYAVMEKAANVVVVDADLGWSDIGSWKAISELYEADDMGNHLRGPVKLADVRDCFVQSDQRLIAAVGVSNLIIVDTGDAVLVADRERSQEVRDIVSQLHDEDHDAATFHSTVYRPWGSYTVLEDADDCKVKRLVVKPGQVLSLQRHQRRSEHWTVIRGTARVRVGDEEQTLQANESAWIPVQTLHRLENPGSEDLHLIEVQTGNYFGEDDIERFEDVYGRV
ncbi:MAG: mannose-1-phosphate guanylyltransferase/mannose-6-phosphate isomerase [Gammaproteobacteria bacterium]|nr:mannose-1-phosphate guanylyltransferase/mannose-6-phosphate isomerase [Gammaproteobacteria bacterium]